jgi:hypothetical protein
MTVISRFFQIVQMRESFASINQIASDLGVVQPDAFLADALHSHGDNGAAPRHRKIRMRG